MLKNSHESQKDPDFTTIYSVGKRHYLSGVLLFYAPHTCSTIRYTCIVGKKYSPLATKRNRQRRILRHALYAYLPLIKPGNDLVISYTNRGNVLTYKKAHATIGALLDRANLIL